MGFNNANFHLYFVELHHRGELILFSSHMGDLQGLIWIYAYTVKVKVIFVNHAD